MTVAQKRRTIAEENRSFQNRREDEYFVVQQREICICLLCDLVITVMKKSNVCKHYSLKHKNMDARYSHGTESRSEKLMCLKTATSFLELSKVSVKGLFVPHLKCHGKWPGHKNLTLWLNLSRVVE